MTPVFCAFSCHRGVLQEPFIRANWYPRHNSISKHLTTVIAVFSPTFSCHQTLLSQVEVKMKRIWTREKTTLYFACPPLCKMRSSASWLWAYRMYKKVTNFILEGNKGKKEMKKKKKIRKRSKWGWKVVLIFFLFFSLLGSVIKYLLILNYAIFPKFNLFCP